MIPTDVIFGINLFFWKKNDPDIVRNTIVKCNRNITVDRREVDQLIAMLTTDVSLLNHRYDLHAEAQDLQSDFLANVVNPNVPAGYDFRFLGIAVNRNLVRSNIEIRYQNPEKDKEIVLNLHLRAGRGVSAQDAFNRIRIAATDFSGDQYELARMKGMNLVNFREREYRIAENNASKEAYVLHRAEQETFSYFRSIFA